MKEEHIIIGHSIMMSLRETLSPNDAINIAENILTNLVATSIKESADVRLVANQVSANIRRLIYITAQTYLETEKTKVSTPKEVQQIFNKFEAEYDKNKKPQNLN